MLTAWLALVFAWWLPQPTATSAQAPPLDYAVFRNRVQPIFLAKRPPHARCVSCHTGATPWRLQPLTPGSTTWDEEQTRKNFDAVMRVVVPGNPARSRLLLHPLAAGDNFHLGGEQWASQDDPEWRTIADWIRRTTPVPGR